MNCTVRGSWTAGSTLIGCLVVGMVILGLAGCSSMKVVTDYSDGIDFMAYETFAYTDSNQNLSTVHPLNHRRIVDAIKGEMGEEGFVEVDADPDVYVTYYASTDQQIVLNTTGRCIIR